MGAKSSDKGGVPFELMASVSVRIAQLLPLVLTFLQSYFCKKHFSLSPACSTTHSMPAWSPLYEEFCFYRLPASVTVHTVFTALTEAHLALGLGKVMAVRQTGLDCTCEPYMTMTISPAEERTSVPTDLHIPRSTSVQRIKRHNELWISALHSCQLSSKIAHMQQHFAVILNPFLSLSAHCRINHESLFNEIMCKVRNNLR